VRTAGLTIGSLFTGVAGLELGLEICGVGPVLWHCERDPYARGVIEHRFPGAVVYRDIRSIDETAPSVDLLCGGFPCQPHSVAGARRGTTDTHKLWPQFARIVRALRPRLVLIENVPGLRTSGLRTVLADLAQLGFDAEWDCFTASEVGALHRRARLFILAYADRDALRVAEQRLPGRRSGRVRDQGQTIVADDGQGGADTKGAGLERRGQGLPRSCGNDVADPNSDGCEVGRVAQPGGEPSAPGGEPHGCGHARWVHRFPPRPDGIREWDGPQPAVCRGAHGTARRVDRLRCLGNAVVPQQAALAWRTLIGRLPAEAA
jgi:DNA (cytosine-5)-methyltransferase 1